MSARPIARLALASGLSLCGASADPGYTSGNILLAHYSETLGAPAVLEYTPAGLLVREIGIPAPAGVTDFKPRDLVVDSSGRIHVMLGIGGADGNLSLATRATNGSWSHSTPGDWSLQGNVTYGGIGINADYIFCPDQTFGGDDTEGIMRFPLDDLGSPEHFSFPGWSFHSVKVGLDGFVYGLNADGDVAWYHPDTMLMFDQLPPGKLNRGSRVINHAVDADGRFYTVDLSDSANRFLSDGELIESVDGGGSLGDIEVHPSGDLLISGSNRKVIMGDDRFTGFCEFLTTVSPDPTNAFRNFLVFADPPVIPPSPSPPSPRIVEVSFGADEVILSIESREGVVYQLERSGDLANWLPRGMVMAGNGAVLMLEDTDPGSPGALFYRVRSEFGAP